MAKLIVALALLAYASASIASAYMPADRMAWLATVAGAAIVLAATVCILARLGNAGEP